MRLKTILFSFIILAISCKYQHNGTQKYLSDLESVYFSHFNSSDSVFWTGNDGQQYAEISDGTYYFESLDSSSRYNAPIFDIDSSDNFLVELALTGPNNQDSMFYGLTFGSLDENNDDFIEFWINNIGEYKITSTELLAEGNYTEQLNTKMKKLTVMCQDMDAHFLINDIQIFKYPIYRNDKLRAGPLTGKKSPIWMDFFKIKKTTLPL